MMFLLLPALNLLMQINLVNAQPAYPSRIPNDFADAGHKWTKTFCEQDSDGDKITNGAELGDPNCTWKQGDPNPNPAGGITDPSIANPGSQPSPTEPNETMTTEERRQRDCVYEKQYPGHFYKNATLTKDFTIPAQETTYIFRYLNLTEFMGTTEPLYLTSGKPIIDNNGHHHHVIIHICPKDHYVEKLIGWEVERATIDEGCATLMGTQTGQKQQCFPNNEGIPIDQDSFSVLVLETHYNNPTKEQGLIDNSAFELGLFPVENAPKDFKFSNGISAVSALTPNRTIFKQFEDKSLEKWKNASSGLLLIGEEFNKDYYYDGSSFKIPANTDYFEHVFSYKVPESLYEFIPEEGLEIFQSFVHGHGKLQKAWTTLTRTNHTNDKTMIACYDDYSYLEPYQFVFPQNDTKSQRIYKDTVLTQHCVYKSHDEPIFNGFATSNEMCDFFGNIYAPQNPMNAFFYFEIMKQDQTDVKKELRDGMGGFFKNYLKPNMYALDKDMVCNADKEKELQSTFSIAKAQQVKTQQVHVASQQTSTPPPHHTSSESTTISLTGSLWFFS
eukprot:Pgem_evm1s8557